jgi:polar amino acid transport system substrate-binding protein
LNQGGVNVKKYRHVILTVSLVLTLFSGCAQRDHAVSETAALPEFRIGIDAVYEPYTYVDDSGNYAGLDVELATEACQRMGRTPVFVPLKWEEKNDDLAAGNIDAIWSCFSMNGREDSYDWVGPYMHSRQVVAVRSDSDVQSLSDLANLRVGVMSTTQPESIFLQRSNESIPTPRGVYCMDSMDLVVAAMENSYVDAVAGHETTLRQYMSQSPGEYRLLSEELLSADVGIAFQVGQNEDLQADLTRALSEMEADGTLERTLERYGIQTTQGSGGEAQ